MILNEDFFDEPDIKEDDIIDSDESEYQSGDEFINICHSQYCHTLIIEVHGNGMMELQSASNILRKLKTKMYNLFDVYDIDHSEMFISDGKTIDENLPLNIFECPDCKFISTDKVNSIHYKSDLYLIVMYANFYQFPPKRALTFAESLMKVVWKDSSSKYCYRLSTPEVHIIYDFVFPCNYAALYNLPSGTLTFSVMSEYNYRLLFYNDYKEKSYFRDVIKFFCGPEVERRVHRCIVNGFDPFIFFR